MKRYKKSIVEAFNIVQAIITNQVRDTNGPATPVVELVHTVHRMVDESFAKSESVDYDIKLLRTQLDELIGKLRDARRWL